MEARETIRSELSAYLDGELDSQTEAKITAALETDEELAAELERLKRVRELVGGQPRMEAGHDFTVEVMRKAKKAAVSNRAQINFYRVAAAATVVVIACGAVLVSVLQLSTRKSAEPEEQVSVMVTEEMLEKDGTFANESFDLEEDEVSEISAPSIGSVDSFEVGDLQAQAPADVVAATPPMPAEEPVIAHADEVKTVDKLRARGMSALKDEKKQVASKSEMKLAEAAVAADIKPDADKQNLIIKSRPGIGMLDESKPAGEENVAMSLGMDMPSVEVAKETPEADAPASDEEAKELKAKIVTAESNRKFHPAIVRKGLMTPEKPKATAATIPASQPATKPAVRRDEYFTSQVVQARSQNNATIVSDNIQRDRARLEKMIVANSIDMVKPAKEDEKLLLNQARNVIPQRGSTYEYILFAEADKMEGLKSEILSTFGVQQIPSSNVRRQLMRNFGFTQNQLAPAGTQAMQRSVASGPQPREVMIITLQEVDELPNAPAKTDKAVK